MELDRGSWGEPMKLDVARGAKAPVPKIDSDFVLSARQRAEARAKAIRQHPHVKRTVADAKQRMTTYRIEKAIKEIADA